MEQLFSDFEKRSPTFTVSEVNRKVAGMIKSDKDFRDCWVIGEVSRVSRPTSGHLYFSLQEGNYVLKAVVWKGSLTPRIRELLTEGSAVEAHGSLTVYEVGGYYQLSIDAVSCIAEATSPVSSLDSTSILTFRLPSAISCADTARRFSGLVILLAISTARSAETTPITIVKITKKRIMVLTSANASSFS